MNKLKRIISRLVEQARLFLFERKRQKNIKKIKEKWRKKDLENRKKV
ncbi:MAG: hypothetical protein ACTJGV_01895 [Proteus vulgaris]|jgi:hypothetical protein